jgi:hypothetical protein
VVRYNFKSSADFKTSLEAVWHEIIDVLSYPLWWPNMKMARILGGESRLQHGSEIYYEIKGFLPYTLKYTVEVIAIQPHSSITLHSSGDLIGYGKLLVEKMDNRVNVTFYWHVSLGNMLLDWLGLIPPIKKLLEKNHDHVMKTAMNALKRRLEK